MAQLVNAYMNPAIRENFVSAGQIAPSLGRVTLAAQLCQLQAAECLVY
jgi:hypothetical protein